MAGINGFWVQGIGLHGDMSPNTDKVIDGVDYRTDEERIADAVELRKKLDAWEAEERAKAMATIAAPERVALPLPPRSNRHLFLAASAGFGLASVLAALSWLLLH